VTKKIHLVREERDAAVGSVVDLDDSQALAYLRLGFVREIDETKAELLEGLDERAPGHCWSMRDRRDELLAALAGFTR